MDIGDVLLRRLRDDPHSDSHTVTWHTPSSFKTGRHSQWWSSTLHLMHLWAQLHRQSFSGICASKSGSCWMNLSSLWPTTVWLQLLLCPYQHIVDCCNLFGCNAGTVVLCACCHITIIVSITIIVIFKWHLRLDALNDLIHWSLHWGSCLAFAFAWQGNTNQQ